METQSDRVTDGRWLMSPRIAGPLFSLLVLLLVAPEAWGGVVRWVLTSGSDNSACTQATPCRTVQHAVDVSSSGDTVSIGQGKFHEYFGVSIAKDLTVEGAGIFSTRVDGAWVGFNIFRIEAGATVTIRRLDVMSGNAATGGGIFNSGDLTLEAVRVRSNSATLGGGGVFNGYGAMLRMSRSEIAKNVAPEGGGLYNLGSAELDEVHIVANHAKNGSGVLNDASSPEFFLHVTRSLISHNTYTGIVSRFNGVTLTNTTVSRNGQLGISSAGVNVSYLYHVTIADNGHGPGQGAFHSWGGLEGSAGSETVLVNTLVANNAGAQCKLWDDASVAAIHSLASDGTCFFPGQGSLVADPKLSPLQWSKVGNTWIHALKSGSPAIDAGSPGYCESVDQRGVLRPIDGDLDGDPQCDIGAAEYSPFKRGWPTENGP